MKQEVYLAEILTKKNETFTHSISKGLQPCAVVQIPAQYTVSTIVKSIQ